MLPATLYGVEQLQFDDPEGWADQYHSLDELFFHLVGKCVKVTLVTGEVLEGIAPPEWGLWHKQRHTND